ncbi:MAG: HEAT repeat domain-containing protein [Fimbriimonadaceae bacterium]|nr:HEAT repeat domain-containing protein [Fimbriimonadaceae bacterium]
MRRHVLTAGLLLAALPLLAATTPETLNDRTRLGQRFTSLRHLAAVAVCVPSWSDNEGGLTLTLWDTPERGKNLASRVVTGVRDNEYVELRPAEPLPPGSYYWEISDRTGTTRIGLYCNELEAESADCAWFDGQPAAKRRFLFQLVAASLPRQQLTALLAALAGTDAELKEAACRQLAVFGSAEAVPALAALLADAKFAHLARYALEGLADPAVDVAFREALHKLTGRLLVGLLNSVAVRRDGGAVGRLAELLKVADPEVAGAAAVALGRIGTPAAAASLEAALPGPESVRGELYEGALECASQLLAAGRSGPATALFDRLRLPPAPRVVQRAATRGAVLARGPAGLALLQQLLRSGDSEQLWAAMWVVQQEWPQPGITLAVAAELRGLPAATQVAVIEALGHRRDRAAVPALQQCASAGELPVRLAAVRALAKLGPAAAPVLLPLLADATPELRQAALASLAALPAEPLAAAARELLAHPEAARRRDGLALVQRRSLPAMGDLLAAALRDPAVEVRQDAAKVLTELGGAAQVLALREALLTAAGGPPAAGLESALAAVAGRAGAAETVAAQLADGLPLLAPVVQASLLRVLGTVGGQRALQAVVAASGGPAGEVRTAAREVLCDWRTTAAAPTLLPLARDAAAGADALKALRALLRLAGDADLPADQRWALCQEVRPLVQREAEQKLLLAALGTFATRAALDLVLPYLEPAATREEACSALLAVADKLAGGAEAAQLVAPLTQVVQRSGNAETVKRAQALLARVTPQ